MSEKLDDYHRHEALDRSNMLANMVASWLMEHPYIESNPPLARKAEDAFDALYALYQAIGLGHLPELKE